MNISKAWGAHLAKALILSLVLSILFSSLVSAVTITSNFSCTNTNAETTFYSYLKSPGLDESSYTSGLRTGTLNYYKGHKAVLTDTLTYQDGINPVSSLEAHNASVSHKLKVAFSGDNNTSKGVSQFYAQGFYNDNHVVSASKKFWYNSQINYPTNIINADATANMDIGLGSYDLKYDASAKNAYFVFNDVTGYSNKTGARRTNWEQEGLLKGEQITLKNYLKATSPYKPRAGGDDDWLPCTCLSGSMPLIEPKYGVWPSSGVYTVLQPIDLMLQRPDCSKGVCGREVKNWRGAGSLLYLDTPSDMEALQTSTTPLVQVESSWVPNDANKAIADFTIKVSNLGNIEADSVVLVLKITDGLNYIGGSATINDVPQEPYRPYNNGSLFWNIGNLLAVAGPDGVKTIKLQATIRGNANPGDSEAYVTYKGGAEIKQSTIPVGATTSANLPLVQVESFYRAADEIIDYIINVRNLGNVDVGGVTLVVNLTDGMQYQEGATIDGIDGKTSEPEISNENHTLTWNLGTLLPVTGPDGIRTIKFAVLNTSTSKPEENTAYVKYKVGTTNANTLKVKSEAAPIHGGGGN